MRDRHQTLEIIASTMQQQHYVYIHCFKVSQICDACFKTTFI